MRRIILASHGMLAEGMKDSVTFIVGHSNNIYTISAYTKEDFSFEAEVKQIFESFNDGDEVIVIIKYVCISFDCRNEYVINFTNYQ